MNGSDANASKCRLKFSSKMIFFLRICLCSVISLNGNENNLFIANPEPIVVNIVQYSFLYNIPFMRNLASRLKSNFSQVLNNYPLCT